MIIIHLVQAEEKMAGPGLINIFQKFVNLPFQERYQLKNPQEKDKEAK